MMSQRLAAQDADWTVRMRSQDVHIGGEAR